LDITETLGAARLLVSRQTDAEDAPLLREMFTDIVLVDAERDVTNEKRVTFRARLVTERTGTGLSFVTGSLIAGVTGFGVVQVDRAAVNLGTALGLVRLLRVGSVDVLDIPKSESHEHMVIVARSVRYSPSGAATLTLSHDADTREFTEVFELATQPFLVDVPRQITNEQIGRVVGFLSLGFLGGRYCLFFGLALLGSFLGHLLALVRLLLGVRVGV
jgi:hypothetical protein